ncbi:hypothetical protein LCGC14_2809050, partial [marine sediment metagenome]
ATSSLDAVKDKFKELGDKISGLIPTLNFGELVEGIGESLDQVVATVEEKVTKIKPIVNKVKFDMEELGQVISSSMERNLTDATTAFQSFGDAARNIIGQVLEALIQLTLVRPFVKGFLAIFGFPGLEHGGRLRANQPGIVGERGPELFVPDVSGQIIPNDRIRIGKGGEGGTRGDIRQEFNFPLVFPTQLEAFVRNVAGPAGRDAATQVLQARRGRF